MTQPTASGIFIKPDRRLPLGNRVAFLMRGTIPLHSNPHRVLLTAGLLGALTTGICLCAAHLRHRTRAATEHRLARHTLPLSALKSRLVADAVSQDLGLTDRRNSDGAESTHRLEGDFRAYVCLRAKGRALADAWGDVGPWRQSLSDAVGRARGHLQPEELLLVDRVEVDLAHSFTPLEPGEFPSVLNEIHRGVKGVQIDDREHGRRWAPTTMLARNLRFDKIGSVLDQPGVASPRRVWLFDAYQLIVELVPEPHGIPMFRGNQIVPVTAVTAESCSTIATLLAQWMDNQLQPDGRMVYKYWPSRGQESSADNTIRQFLATICLQRMRALHDSDDLASRISRNLAFNLQKFYRSEDDLGFIEFRGRRKLGAAALAAVAIMESPERESHAPAESGLRRLVDHLSRPDGSFQTNYGEPAANDNQNFYPGEALLLWAKMYHETRDAERLAKFMRAFDYYQRWHHENRNPAFVPWHTMAYYVVWQITRDPELERSILDMNDWLLGMQQWDDAPYPDVRGRFYDPSRPEYGPPHASATGVYLEGLIDAFSLARQLGDHRRMQRYREAVVRGLRSVFQLQFSDDVDMYYISRSSPVHGGLRTTVYNNEIRVDNVQHVLMALMKILEVFDSNDYQLGVGGSPSSDPPE